METASNVPASEEDIVSQLLYAPFSRLTFNEKLELIGKGRPTFFVQKTKAFESLYVIVLCRMADQSVD